MKGIKGVIFDLDGTLIDSFKVYIKALNQGIEKFGLEGISTEFLAELLNEGVPLDGILERISPIFKERDRRERCREEIIKAYRELEKTEVFLLPSVKEVLMTLKERGLKVAILSGRTFSGEEKWLELKRLGIETLIDCFFTSAEVPRKPRPEGLLRCIEELRLKKEDCLFVGDSEADMDTGKKAGVKTVGVTTGVGKRERLLEKRPDYLIERLSDLLSIL